MKILWMKKPRGSKRRVEITWRPRSESRLPGLAPSCRSVTARQNLPAVRSDEKKSRHAGKCGCAVERPDVRKGADDDPQSHDRARQPAQLRQSLRPNGLEGTHYDGDEPSRWHHPHAVARTEGVTGR